MLISLISKGVGEASDMVLMMQKPPQSTQHEVLAHSALALLKRLQKWTEIASSYINL